MGADAIVKVKGSSLSVKTGKAYVIDEKQLLQIARRIVKACEGDLDKLEEYTSRAVSYLKKYKFGKGRNKSEQYEQVLKEVEVIYKKQKRKNLQKARLEFANSEEIKFIIGGKTKALQFIKNAQRYKFKTESLSVWKTKVR